MDPAAPRDGDDRLVAVGRALAQSLLAGREIDIPERHHVTAQHAAVAEDHPTPTSEVSDLRTDCYIPAPADVVPGTERMEPPRRRRRHHDVGTPDESPTLHQAPSPVDVAAPAIAAEVDLAIDIDPALDLDLDLEEEFDEGPATADWNQLWSPLAPDPLDEPPSSHELAVDAPQVARVRTPDPTFDATLSPYDTAAFSDVAIAGPSAFTDRVGDPGTVTFDGAPAWADDHTVAEVAARNDAPMWPTGPAWTDAEDTEASEPTFDAHAHELFESLPWSADEPAPTRGERRPKRRRGHEAKATTESSETPEPPAIHAPAPPLALEPPAPLEIAPRSEEWTGPRRARPSADDTGFSAATGAAWIADHPVLERPDESKVRLVGRTTADHEDAPVSARRTVAEWAMVLGSAVVVALLVKFFVIQSFSIPSESMYPTLKIDDRVVVNQLAYDVGGDVERFDVIVFHRVEGPGPARPDDPEFLIKRVIGLPGETVEARGGVVYIDGKPIDESAHLDPEVVTNNITQPIEIPAGHYWVMGDNRERSGDSRIFGPVPRDHVVGRAVAVWWPFDRAGSL